MNGQKPSKESAILKENHISEQHEQSQNGDQNRGSVFIHYCEYGKEICKHFLCLVNIVGAFSTYQNGRLLCLNKFWELSRV